MVLLLTAYGSLLTVLPGCYRKLEDIPIKRAPADSIPLSLSVPLSAEVAAALNGVAQQDDLVADVELNGEIVAEGVRGGVRGGLRGDVQGGVQGAQASGVRGGIRGAPSRQDPLTLTLSPSGRGNHNVSPRPQNGGEGVGEGELAFAFEVTFFIPRKSAKDGENSVRTRVRPSKHQDVPLVEVKTTIKIRLSDQQSAVSDQPGGGAGSSSPGSEAEGGKLSADSFVIEIEETAIALKDVELPDLDGNGVATLTEVAAVLALPVVGARHASPLQEAIAIASDASSTAKPTQEQVQAAFESLAAKLETKVKDDFKAAGVAPPASVKIELKEIDLTPPDTFVSAEALGERREAQVGQDIQIAFNCNENACAFRCTLDGSLPEPCSSPRVLHPAPGAHTFGVFAIDAMGNRDPSPATVGFTVLPPPPLCVASTEVCDGKDNDCGGAVDEGNVCDTTAPDTTLVGAGLPAQTSCAYSCKLDQPSAPGAFTSCLSPLALSLSKGSGSYTFTVQGSDPAGNAGSASYTWTLDLAAPGVAISSQPSNPSNSTSASFTFTSPDGTATFECSLDGSACAACTSPKGCTSLAAAAHSFNVRAKDAAGNTDATPATYSWTIDLTPPTFGGLTAAVASGLTKNNSCFYLVRAVDQAGNSDANTVEKADTAGGNAWVSKVGMPTARSGPAAVGLNGKIYVIGGGNPGNLDVVEEYDPVPNTWAAKASMPTARGGLAAAEVNGKIYAIGGNSGAYLGTNEEDDPVANTWATKIVMTTARQSLGMASLDGRIYAIGGWNGSDLSANEVYTPPLP